MESRIVVSAQVPPTLLIDTWDDPIDPIPFSEVHARKLAKAGVEAKPTSHEADGHAFDVSRQGTDSDRWTDVAIQWLREAGTL